MGGGVFMDWTRKIVNERVKEDKEMTVNSLGGGGGGEKRDIGSSGHNRPISSSILLH